MLGGRGGQQERGMCREAEDRRESDKQAATGKRGTSRLCWRSNGMANNTGLEGTKSTATTRDNSERGRWHQTQRMIVTDTLISIVRTTPAPVVHVEVAQLPNHLPIFLFVLYFLVFVFVFFNSNHTTTHTFAPPTFWHFYWCERTLAFTCEERMRPLRFRAERTQVRFTQRRVSPLCLSAAAYFSAARLQLHYTLLAGLLRIKSDRSIVCRCRAWERRRGCRAAHSPSRSSRWGLSSAASIWKAVSSHADKISPRLSAFHEARQRFPNMVHKLLVGKFGGNLYHCR